MCQHKVCQWARQENITFCGFVIVSGQQVFLKTVDNRVSMPLTVFEECCYKSVFNFMKQEIPDYFRIVNKKEFCKINASDYSDKLFSELIWNCQNESMFFLTKRQKELIFIIKYDVLEFDRPVDRISFKRLTTSINQNKIYGAIYPATIDNYFIDLPDQIYNNLIMKNNEIINLGNELYIDNSFKYFMYGIAIICLFFGFIAFMK